MTQPQKSQKKKYNNRTQDLTDEIKDIIAAPADNRIPPEDVLKCFCAKFEDSPLLTA
eukprot:CAMPEP_0117696694 /NCGR_PEP_ID=MMETSP0804-20121206/28814_1 /TAXON_ID=1074897 /ORGANISM="Tetraselmis astigmatica, Strain CCMP880" /LENGTH=56 /DNA_ID=CAMNT_0005510859 /DNA_START=319 /DNA_END=490 /DNA_ORIENTATION=+